MMGGYFITAQEQLVGRAYLLFLGIIKANCIHFSSFKLIGQRNFRPRPVNGKGASRQ